MQPLDTGQFKHFERTPQGAPRFITFEGGEGAGKSTQIARLKAFLTERGQRVLVCREPGSTPFGEQLRQAILDSNAPLHPRAELHLFLAARAQLMAQRVCPFLAQGPEHIVLLDRYLDSSLVYQGIARGLGVEEVLNYHRVEPLHYLPHLTIVLQVALSTSRQRLAEREEGADYFEQERPDFHQRVHQGFAALKTLFPQRVVEIEANRPPQEVFQAIQEALLP